MCVRMSTLKAHTCERYNDEEEHLVQIDESPRHRFDDSPTRFRRVGMRTTCLSAALLLLLLFVAHRRLVERQRCHMTVMWYWPTFIKLNISTTAAARFPSYRLIAYGEAKYAESLIKGRFEGAPVLFIPGNAGKDRQVRSLGSVSFMKTVNRMRANESMQEFNYFAVDFDEQYSALSGRLLEEQTEFTRLALQRIMQLYENDTDVKQVIVVGHSMGGLIGRSLLSHADVDARRIAALLTLATPHRPVLPYDRTIVDYYAALETREKALVDERRTNSLPTLLSIAGGSHDRLVPAEFTRLPAHLDRLAYTMWSTSVRLSNVWASSDHLCVVWCNQLTTKTTRALFDMLDDGTAQIDDDAERRRAIWHAHFMAPSVVRSLKEEEGEEEEEFDDHVVQMVLPEDNNKAHRLPSSPPSVGRCIHHVAISTVVLTYAQTLSFYTDRYSNDIVGVCVDDACLDIDFEHDSLPSATLLDDYWQMILLGVDDVSRLRIGGVDRLAVVAHNALDRRRANVSNSYVQLADVNYIELMRSPLDWFFSSDSLILPADRQTVVRLLGFEDSVVRAMFIDVQGIGCQNLTVAWLSVDACADRTPDRLQSTFINNGTYDTLHVHHHDRSMFDGRPVCVRIVPTPFAQCAELRFDYSSDALKAVYVTMQLNTFGLQHVHLVVAGVAAVAALAHCASISASVVPVVVVAAIVRPMVACSEEGVVVIAVAALFYIAVTTIVCSIIHAVEYITSHISRFGLDHRIPQLWLPWHVVVVLSVFVCGWLPLFALLLHVVLRGLQPSTGRTQYVTMAMCLVTLCASLTPSAILAQHAIINEYTLPVHDSSRLPAIVCLVTILLARIVQQECGRLPDWLLTCACWVTVFYCLTIKENTWTMQAMSLAPSTALMYAKHCS